MKTTNTKRTRCTKKEIVFLRRQFSVQGDDKKAEILDMATARRTALDIAYQEFSYLNIKLFSSQQKTLHRVCDIKSAGLRSEQWIGTTQIADLSGHM